MNSLLKLTKKATCFVLFTVLSSGAWAIESNKIKITLSNGQVFGGSVSAALVPRNRGNYEFVLITKAKLSDRQIAHLSMSARIDKKLINSRMSMSTKNNNLSYVMRSNSGDMIITRAVEFAKANSSDFSAHQKPGQPGFYRKPPAWQKMSKTQRLQKGQGIMVAESQRGLEFNLTLIPIKDEEKLVGYTILCSGVGKLMGPNAPSGQPKTAFKCEPFRVKLMGMEN
jgi:hypothetical protein